jgi:hypothetical protein
MKRILYVVPVLVLGLAACSSDKGTATPSSTSFPVTPAAATTPAASTTPAQAPGATSPVATPSSASPTPVKTKPAVPNVKAQVLALSDLPAGWSKHKIDNSTDGEPACFKALDADTREPLAKAQVEYQGTPNGLPLLDEEIAYDPKAAASEFTKAVKALDRCGKISVKTNGTTLSGAMGAMSFPKMGDQTKAYQLTLSGVVRGVRVTAGFDILVLRVGAEDVSLLYSTFGAPDIREFQGAAKLVMDKINGAGTTA